MQEQPVTQVGIMYGYLTNPDILEVSPGYYSLELVVWVLCYPLACHASNAQQVKLLGFPEVCTSILVAKIVTPLLSATFKIECR